MYLFSYIIDHVAYPWLLNKCPEQSWLLTVYLPMVGGIVAVTWLLSWLKERLFRICRLPRVLG